jgi:hypothetical protein
MSQPTSRADVSRESSRDHFGHHAAVLDWDREFIPWTRGKYRAHDVAGQRVPLPDPWKPGTHWALCGVTGDGKSTHAVGMLATRKWVCALDPKGEDETLESAGYMRLRSMPPPRKQDKQIWDRVNQGLPVGLVVGFEAKTDADDDAMRKLMRDTIDWTRRSRGWTLYVDEFELLSSQRMMHLGDSIERMLITARRAGTSVVTAFQNPAWVSKHAIRQAGFTTIWQTGNQQMIKAIAEATGRDWRELAAAVDELPKWHSVTIPKDMRRPMIITSAPKV